MAIFTSGREANIYALNSNANAMHLVRYFEIDNDEPCEVTEYWVKDKDQDQSEFNKNLGKAMSYWLEFGSLSQYQRIDFN